MISGLPPAHAANGLRRHALRCVRAAVVGLVAAGLVITAPGVSRADGLDDKKKTVDSQLAQSKHDLAEYNQEAIAAAAALKASQEKLARAQAALQQAEAAERAAQAEDARLAAELKVAQDDLAKAKAAAAKAKAEVEAFQKKIGSRAREQMQQRTGVSGMAILITDTTSGDLAQKVQWSTTIFDSSGKQMDRLRQLKIKADAAQGAATAAEAKVAEARKKAADQLAASQRASQQAAGARNSVATATQELSVAKSKADSQVAAETKRQQALQSEQTSVNARIAERIRRQKAEAAARARAEAQRQAAARKAAANKTNTTKNPNKKQPPISSSTGTLFSMPVSGPITSSYGMRLHPVLGYWKLHDGTDFGASCGTPIRAPRDGVVAERYYNGGYGNRLMIDHGMINGSYVTTGYNHATHYVVGVGQRVSRGQIIGYVGSTGYSTGCHLHLMVWDDGAVVNPMNWF